MTDVDGCGEQPVHHAARSGNAKILMLLADCRADLAARTCTGSVGAIHLAAAGGHLAAIRALSASAGASCLELPDCQGKLPVHYAAFYGEAAAVAELLHLGAISSATDDSGCTPLDDGAKWPLVVSALRRALQEEG